MLSHAAFSIFPLSFEVTHQTLDHFQVVVVQKTCQHHGMTATILFCGGAFVEC